MFSVSFHLSGFLKGFYGLELFLGVFEYFIVTSFVRFIYFFDDDFGGVLAEFVLDGVGGEGVLLIEEPLV